MQNPKGLSSAVLVTRPVSAADPGITKQSAEVQSAATLVMQILGPLRIWRDGVELDTGPRQQARLLALLLVEAGRPVSTSQLIDLVWEDRRPSSVDVTGLSVRVHSTLPTVLSWMFAR